MIGSAKKSVGTGLKDWLGRPDMRRMRAWRLGRLRAELKRRDYAAAILFDPINIRYATGSRNMAVWTLHNAARWLFLPSEGPTILYDFHGCAHLSAGLETIGEVRPARAWFFFSGGDRAAAKARAWAGEMASLVREHGGGNRRVAIDRLDAHGLHAIEAEGIEVFDAQEPCEIARSVKSEDEILCMLHAIAVCEAGMAKMRAALEPGVTEQELWSLLNEVNLRMGGEWIETRLLASGGNTNPWFHEADDRVIRPGDLVSFDTDLIGPFGYCADLSRTFIAGPAGRAPSSGVSTASRSSRSTSTSSSCARASRWRSSGRRHGGSRTSSSPTATRSSPTASGSATSGRRWCTARTPRRPTTRCFFRE